MRNKILILISKKEMEYLLQHGARWGKDLHHTYGHNKTYYCTENPKLLSVIKKYRESNIVMTRS